MKQFFCGDVVPGCDHTFQGASDDDILGQVAEHGKSAHGMSEVPPEVAEQVRSKIQDV